jgi:hypothetical protein
MENKINNMTVFPEFQPTRLCGVTYYPIQGTLMKAASLLVHPEHDRAWEI